MLLLDGKWRGYGASVFRGGDRPEIVTVEICPRGLMGGAHSGKGRPRGAMVTILDGPEGPRVVRHDRPERSRPDLDRHDYERLALDLVRHWLTVEVPPRASLSPVQSLR